MTQNELQTPCYIIHKDILLNGIEKLKTALKEYWPNSLTGYSFKTNALPWALNEMKKAGLYAEVVSEDEYDLAEYLQFEHIIYNGPVKGKRSFLQALGKPYIINLDSFRELDWLEEADNIEAMIGIRANFNLEELCPGETSAGIEGSRFGFSYETGEFESALNRLKSMGIKISGIHLHCGSKTRSVKIYQGIARMACRLQKEYGLELSYVDVGGGFFGGMENKPQFADYVKAIREELLTAFDPEKTTLILEPGTSLITPPVEYVTTVTDCKHTWAGNFVVTDGSRIDIDPKYTKSSYFHQLHYENTEEKERKQLKKQVICGFTCMEDDRLFVCENRAELLPGDRILFQKVGGYTMCLTPLFIRYFPWVYAEEDGNYECVREHWKEEEFTAKSHWRI